MTKRESAVAAEIVGLVEEDLRLKGKLLAPDEHLAGWLDSLQLLALVVAVEDRFHIILTDDDAAKACTVSDLACLVSARTDDAGLPARGVP